MVPVSIIIITKNEADIVACCIHKARLITDDVVIIDSGSTDETADIAEMYGCRVYKKPWEGYGTNKNTGIEAAKYDWILSVDADEVPDEELTRSLHKLSFDDPAMVYDIKFKSYFGKKPVHFGNWGRDHHIRLFNRKLVKWSETMVHETLVLPEGIATKKITGRLHHFSVKDISEYDSKCAYYANLSAKKYFREGKKSGIIKLYLSPLFGFIRNYFFYLGFLDGRAGWDIAKTTAKNTRRKYQYLNQLENQQGKKQSAEDKFAMEYH